MNYRLATIEDIDQLVLLRKKQLIDEGILPDIEIDEELYQFFCNRFADRSLVEWLGVDQAETVATAAIVFYEFPPTYTNRSGIKGYITNMYTNPRYRKQGIATHMLDLLVEEAKTREVEKLWLGASKLGRPVYLKYGFSGTDEWLELNNICGCKNE